MQSPHLTSRKLSSCASSTATFWQKSCPWQHRQSGSDFDDITTVEVRAQGIKDLGPHPFLSLSLSPLLHSGLKRDFRPVRGSMSVSRMFDAGPSTELEQTRACQMLDAGARPPSDNVLRSGPVSIKFLCPTSLDSPVRNRRICAAVDTQQSHCQRDRAARVIPSRQHASGHHHHDRFAVPAQISTYLDINPLRQPIGF